MSKDGDDQQDSVANPGGQFASEGDAENGKSRDWPDAGMKGTKAQDHADRRGKAGNMTDAGGPLEGNHGTNSQ